MQSTKYEAQGMTSGGCIGSAQDAVSKFGGVFEAEVTLQLRAATAELSAPIQPPPSRCRTRPTPTQL